MQKKLIPLRKPIAYETSYGSVSRAYVLDIAQLWTWRDVNEYENGERRRRVRTWEPSKAARYTKADGWAGRYGADGYLTVTISRSIDAADEATTVEQTEALIAALPETLTHADVAAFIDALPQGAHVDIENNKYFTGAYDDVQRLKAIERSDRDEQRRRERLESERLTTLYDAIREHFTAAGIPARKMHHYGEQVRVQVDDLAKLLGIETPEA